VFPCHLFLKSFYPGFLELGDHPAFLAHQVVVMRHEVVLIPLQPIPEIKLFCVAKPCQKFYGAVNRRISDGTVPPADGMGKFLDRHVGSRSEKYFDHLCTAFAPLSADRGDLGLDPL
jgi:hypothetical protein